MVVNSRANERPPFCPECVVTSSLFFHVTHVATHMSHVALHDPNSCQKGKWTQACDRRWARLSSYILHKNEFRQYCHLSNTAQHCRLGLFQDSDFAGDLKDSKSTSGESYVFSEAEHLSPSGRCARNKTSVFHSSTKSKIISLDPRLRMDGLFALDLCDMVIEVLRSTNHFGSSHFGSRRSVEHIKFAFVVILPLGRTIANHVSFVRCHIVSLQLRRKACLR